MITGLLPPRAITWRCHQVRLGVARLTGWLRVPQDGLAQTSSTSVQALASAGERIAKPASNTTPLTDRERAELLQLIGNLQERVARLEAQVSASVPPIAPDAKPLVPAGASGAPSSATVNAAKPEPVPAVNAKAPKQCEEQKEWGTYTPNLGFKRTSTEYSGLDISIYTSFAT